MPANHKTSAIRKAKFIKALVDSGGNITEAYQQTRPNVTRQSAGEMGSRELKKIQSSELPSIMDKLGISIESVVKSVADRLKKPDMKDCDFFKGTELLAKLCKIDTNASHIKTYIDFELVDIVKLRLKPKQTEVIDVKEEVPQPSM